MGRTLLTLLITLFGDRPQYAFGCSYGCSSVSWGKLPQRNPLMEDDHENLLESRQRTVSTALGEVFAKVLRRKLYDTPFLE